MSRPFNQKRYTALLEGLEISDVRLSDINSEVRIEAEFFWKRYLHEVSALSRLPLLNIGEFANVTDGPHGYHVVDETSPVVMLTAKNTKGWFTDKEQAAPLALFVHEANQRSNLQENDIVLSTRGTVGLCALVTHEVLPANIDQDVARISLKDSATIKPGFLVAYLNSSFGQDHMKRFSSGMVQQGLSLQKVREIPIPMLSDGFQMTVSNIALLSLTKFREATASQTAAEQTLLRALGLEGWQPPEPLTYIRKASEAMEANRLDAEFYFPKYEALRSFLASKFKVSTLKQLGQVLKGSSVGYDEAGTVPIIRSGDLSDISDDDRFKRSLPGEDITDLEPGDVLISSIGFGSIGKVQVFNKAGRFGTVSEVTIVRQNQINPYYLNYFLRSKAGQTQINQFITGATGQLHLYPRDVAKIVVPIIPEKQQKDFEIFARSAHTARKTARELLDRAKRAVEIAIEQGEAAALKLLSQV